MHSKPAARKQRNFILVHSPGHLVRYFIQKIDAIRVNSNDIYSLMIRKSEYQCSLYQRQITTSLLPKQPRKRSISVLFLFSFFQITSRCVDKSNKFRLRLSRNTSDLCGHFDNCSNENKSHAIVHCAHDKVWQKQKTQKMKQMECGYVFIY